MFNKIKMYFLKRKAKNLRLQMIIYENNYNCSPKFIEEINADYSCLSRDFKVVMNKLKQLDKNYPKN